jgi:hypothetical protein
MSSDHKHGHDHDHPHPFQPDDDAGPPSEHMLLVRALRELLIEKGIYTADEERRTIERMDARSPAGGAKMVARAWVDPAYRARVVVEPRAVLAEFGTELPETTEIRVHDSTADMRYMVLPMRPEGTQGWSEEALAAQVSRDAMIGVSLPETPGTTP